MLNLNRIYSLLERKPAKCAFYETIDSTNKKASLINIEEDEYMLIIAQKQTAGRGRFKREWYSPEGGLYISVSLRTSQCRFPLTLLSVAGAAALEHYLKSMSIENLCYRWPNDILAGQLKIGGILSEIAGDKVITGIGINLNIADFPSRIKGTATSVLARRGVRSDPCQCTASIVNHYLYLKDNPSLIIDYLNNTPFIGREINVKTIDSQYRGRVKGFDSSGLLILDTGKEEIEIYEGDLEILR
ncbi:MAG: biotin--[acetyl-CoA-carboxylase] ligase [candidate division WOR-3 bacterium]|nr:biotin--[acetyl-CoA-carboxylase] ligase [candidate division WOR-3 bacterium]